MTKIVKVVATLILAANVVTGQAAELVIDNAKLGEKNDNQQAVEKNENVKTDELNKHKSITCSASRGMRSSSPSAAAKENPEVVALARRVAKEEGVREDLFLGLVYQESRFNACARSPVGAFGLTQLMPDTAKSLGVNQYDVEQNLRGGARYLATQLKRYNGNEQLALAAYNAGPGNVNKFGGIPPFKETNEYVYNITQKWKPAFAGIENTALPAYSYAADTTIGAMAVDRATQDNITDAQGWYKNISQTQTATVLDAWDANTKVRNANTELVNQVITLGATIGDLLNARNAENVQTASQAAKFLSQKTEKPATREECLRSGMAWDDYYKKCIDKTGDDKKEPDQ